MSRSGTAQAVMHQAFKSLASVRFALVRRLRLRVSRARGNTSVPHLILDERGLAEMAGTANIGDVHDPANIT